MGTAGARLTFDFQYVLVIIDGANLEGSKVFHWAGFPMARWRVTKAGQFLQA
jgi:hypothetical protein